MGGHLDEGARTATGGQALEDAADGGGGGLIAGQQQFGRLGRVPVEADSAAGAALVGADDENVAADPCGLQPARGRAEKAVAGVGDENHVDLALLGPHRANRVGAKWATVGVGQRTPAGIPVAVDDGALIVSADVGETPTGKRQHDFDALVEPGRAGGVELFAEKGHPGEVIAERAHAHHRRAIGTVGRAVGDYRGAGAGLDG